MNIDEEALKRAADSLYSALGPLNDLPPELRNTLANVYYKFYAFSRNLRDPSQILGYNNSDPMSAYMGFMKGSADVLADFEHASDMIKGMRDTRKQDQNIYEYLVTLTLDLFKYRIPNAHQKTPIRRAIERKFKIPKEIDGLYERMEKLRNNDR